MNADHDRPERSPHDDKARWAPRLRRALGSLRSAQMELEDLLPRQAGLIETGDAEGLLQLLGERQAVIERLQKAGDGFEPFRSRWDELMTALDARERDEMQASLREVSDSMTRLAERDASDRARLEELRRSIVEELSGVQRGRSAVAAYGGGGPNGPRFQDRAG